MRVNGDRRPSNTRHPTAPPSMMNSHFAPVGEDASREQYERGIQVIDEDKEFKWVFPGIVVAHAGIRSS